MKRDATDILHSRCGYLRLFSLECLCLDLRHHTFLQEFQYRDAFNWMVTNHRRIGKQITDLAFALSSLKE